MEENGELNETNYEDQPIEEGSVTDDSQDALTKVTGMYKDWFLDYASYVILERAVERIG